MRQGSFTRARLLASSLGARISRSTSLVGASRPPVPVGRAEALRPVSMSYPPGDPGREDEYIEAVLARWGHLDRVPESALEPAEATAAADEAHWHLDTEMAATLTDTSMAADLSAADLFGADLSDGLLSVELERPETARTPRRINISTGALK